jgi:hypothetical protein
VKAKRTEEDHAGHNNGGAAIAPISLDVESSKSCNSNSKELG